MKYDDMPKLDCLAEEEDWLNVNFSSEQTVKEAVEPSNLEEPHFIKKMSFKKAKKIRAKEQVKNNNNSAGFIKRHYKKAAVVMALLLILVGMLFIDTGFVGNIFQYAKQTVTSSLFGSAKNVSVELSTNAVIDKIEDGNIVIMGGKLVLNIEKGVVEKIEEKMVTVKVNDNFSIVYSNISEVMVTVSQNVMQNDIIGRYSESATVNFIYKGNKVIDVVQNNNQLEWKI